MPRAAFCAVPAPIRVEPAMASGPVSRKTGTSTVLRRGEAALLERPMVSAPASRAATVAATVKGVEPLAATAMTASDGFGPRRTISARPRSASSSTPPGMPGAIL